MADAVNPGFARSELLKKEWAALRDEIAALDPSAADLSHRRAAIQTRMNDITKEMAAVLTQTRKLIPTPDIDDDDDQNDHAHTHSKHSPSGSPAPNGASAHRPYIQYSARNLHIVQRTYDSTDDEGEEEQAEQAKQAEDAKAHAVVQPPPCAQGSVSVLDLDDLFADKSGLNQPPKAANKVIAKECDPEADELRKSLMMDATSSDTVITVEGRQQHDKGFRAGLGGLSHMIKDRLRGAEQPLTEEEREQLTLEQSRLERELRKLKRIPGRSQKEQRRFDELSSRIAKISDKLGKAAVEEAKSQLPNGKMAKDEDWATNSSASLPNTPTESTTAAGMKGRKSALFGASRNGKSEKHGGGQPGNKTGNESVASTQDGDLSLEPQEAMSPNSPTGAKSSASKRKKGWFVLEAGVASIRALGRNFRAASSPSPKTDRPTEHGESSSAPGNVSKVAQDDGGGGGGSVFAEAAERLTKRGEKLNTAANDSERMANDAGDMLDAARALRQRNQKGGFFS